MGAFLTNLHVRSADLAAVADALRAVRRAEGLVEAGDGEEADRATVLIGSDGWVSIYDEAAESQDPAVLDADGAAVSRAGAPAFSVTVHDSDVLLLGLYVGGETVDRYDSNPAYFGGRKRRGPPEPHLARWAPVLADDAARGALREALTIDPLMAEAALAPLARATGVDPARLQVGWRYLQEQPLPGGHLVLRFRDPRVAADAPGGPPLLRTDWQLAGMEPPPGASPPVQAAVGAEVRLALTTRNAAGPGTGVEVRVTGGDGLVRWLTAQLVLGHPGKGGQVVEAPLVDGVASFPDAPIPPGAAPIDPQRVSAATLHKQLDARFAAGVHVNVIGTGSAAGGASVAVTLAPLGAPARGVTASFAVAVRTTEGRPLRAPETLHPTQLAVLEDRALAVALVLLEPATATARAGALLGALRFPETGKVRTVSYPATKGGVLGAVMGLMKSPKLSTGKAAGFADGARARALLDQVGDGAAQVEATWVEHAEDVRSVVGWTFGRGILPSPTAVPALTVALPGDDDAVRALVAAVDAAATGGGVLQAVVTRWGQPATPDQTPYELACGVHGQCTLDRSWATRWLRAIGPGAVWLGPELRARLDPAPPGATVGGTLRVDVTDVGAAERALAAVLPDARDWQAGVAARYGRG